MGREHTITHRVTSVGPICDTCVMCHEHHGCSLRPSQAEKFLQDSGGIAAVKRTGWLIGEHDGWPVHQCPSNRDALTLPSGHLRRAPIPQICETKSPQDFASRRKSLGLTLSSQAEGKCGILLHRQLGQ